LAGVTVNYVNTHGDVFTTVTDSNGHYEFDNLYSYDFYIEFYYSTSTGSFSPWGVGAASTNSDVHSTYFGSSLMGKTDTWNGLVVNKHIDAGFYLSSTGPGGGIIIVPVNP
jgi:hypothetical protein